MKALIEKLTGSKTTLIVPTDNDRDFRVVTQNMWKKIKVLGVSLWSTSDSTDNSYEWESLPPKGKGVGFGK